jgi:catechol 2,3-dioxygenase-like lactoylglutathione lyase family enzyme
MPLTIANPGCEGLLPMQVDALDRIVLTVNSIPVTVKFYSRLLGMEVITFGAGRTALRFGQQKINLHEQGNTFEPKARHPLPGSADLCFVTQDPLEAVIEHFHQCGVALLAGPVARTGANGPMRSVYCRDPDANLIEVASYLP